jgi:hypothetical protein
MVMAGHRYFIVSVREKEGIGRGEFTLNKATFDQPPVTTILTENRATTCSVFWINTLEKTP